jgi:hypothetical protein
MALWICSEIEVGGVDVDGGLGGRLDIGFDFEEEVEASGRVLRDRGRGGEGVASLSEISSWKLGRLCRFVVVVVVGSGWDDGAFLGRPRGFLVVEASGFRCWEEEVVLEDFVNSLLAFGGPVASGSEYFVDIEADVENARLAGSVLQRAAFRCMSSQHLSSRAIMALRLLMGLKPYLAIWTPSSVVV